MRIFLTGATGFIGSYLVAELVGAGHHVVGLTRSEAGAEALVRAGAGFARGDVNDLEALRNAAKNADGVIHTAFNHDFAVIQKSSEEDRAVIATLGDALAGSHRPLIVTSGTGLVRPKPGQAASENDAHMTSAEFPRASCEEAADALVAQGVHAIVMRLPQVHDTHKQGRISLHIELARKQGRVAYVGEGKNRVPAAHVSDVVRAYRLALENGNAGARYHAVGEEGIALRDICEAIAARLNLPAQSITNQEAPQVFGGMARLVTLDLAASGELTKKDLGWNPTGPSLLSDLRNLTDA